MKQRPHGEQSGMIFLGFIVRGAGVLRRTLMAAAVLIAGAAFLATYFRWTRPRRGRVTKRERDPDRTRLEEN